MKQKEKDSIMLRYISGEIDILVSTTVIEVGIDVPNAALIIIENAERFGLSQLHQLRGRVGRGSNKSYCILISSAKTEATRSRLKIMCSTNDGFKIAEEDLKLRGPGDFFGNRQHGIPKLKIADLATDSIAMNLATAEANRILSADPILIKPENRKLRNAVIRLFRRGTSN